MAENASTVSVIIVTWNGAALLPACLDSVLAQVGVSPAPEIVVVDNGSDDDTLGLLASSYPSIRVVTLPANLGFAGGVNAGLEIAGGDAIVLLNNDAVADPSFVASALAALNSDARIAAVTGLIVLEKRYSPGGDPADALVSNDARYWTASPLGTELVNSTGGEVTRSANGRDRDWLVPRDSLLTTSGPASAFSGGAAMLRTAALRSVGGFDAKFFMYYEDSDLSWRLRRAGWAIRFERGAVVVHKHAASSGSSSDFFLFHNERNRLLFALKHGTAGVVALATWRSLGALARAILRRDRTAVRRRIRALASALRLSGAFLADRRELDRRAAVPRRELWRDAPHD